MNDRILDTTFKTLLMLVGFDGGDGDGVLYCRYIDYKETADEFEQYLTKINDKLQRINNYDKDLVLFTDKCNENIHIAKYKGDIPTPISGRYIIVV